MTSQQILGFKAAVAVQRVLPRCKRVHALLFIYGTGRPGGGGQWIKWYRKVEISYFLTKRAMA